LQRISQQQAISSTWTPSFYGYDGGGTVRALTNSAGTVTDTYEYDSFGNHWTAEGSTPNDMLYRGEEWDPDLSLLYLRARYMNPLTGRFLSMDPENGELTSPSTLHRYLYAGADGVNLVDPTGRASIAENIPILLAATAVAATGVVLFRNEVNCSYDWNGTRTGSTVYAGAFGTTAQIGPCTWQGLRQDSQPSIYPLPYPFPISTPAPSGPYGTPGGCDSGGGEQWHHIVPQAERSWAEGCGFNIDQPGLGMCIKGSCHSQIHGNSNGTNWNAEWQYQINNVWRGACPSDQQLVSFAQSLVSQFADDILCQ
jgi:RHS repeat-associated protein